MNIFSSFIGERSLVYLSDITDFKHYKFDLLEESHKLSFFISDIETINSEFIETESNVYILYDLSIDKSNLYYQYDFLKSRTKKEIQILGYELEGYNLTLRMYGIHDNRFQVQEVTSFKLCDFMIDELTLRETVDTIQTVNSFEVFPQADNFDLIWKIFDSLENIEYTRDDIASLIINLSGGIVDRQISYYLSALLYLNIVTEPQKSIYKISSSVAKVKKESLSTQIEFLIKSILKHEVFNITFKNYLKNNTMADCIMKLSTPRK